MDSNLKEEFHFQTGGTLLALRVILVALMKTHPEPEKLLNAIKELLQKHDTPLEGNLPAPIQAAFDDRMQEMTSHLYLRLKN